MPGKKLEGGRGVMDWSNISGINLLEGDCMEFMETMPDGCFELAIVDPPYGIGKSWTHDNSSPMYKHRSTYRNDKPPDKKYVIDLFRVSQNQIIWGVNYFWDLFPPTNNLIFWDKQRDVQTQFNSEGELAWTSFPVPMRKIKLLWCGCASCEPRTGIHPHEKPVKLYEWLLTNYAKPGDKILDTHAGSFSSAIACHNLGFDGVFIEKDADYFEAGKRRVEMHQRQGRLF